MGKKGTPHRKFGKEEKMKYACLIFIKNAPSVCRNRRGFVCHNKSVVCHNCIRKLLQRNVFLLVPVVPDVLDVIVVFHGVDELLHLGALLFAQGLIVLGNHFDLSGDKGEEIRTF